MSYGLEIAEEIELSYQADKFAIASAAANGIWTTKDGRQLKICDMNTEHIENTLAFIKRDSLREDLFFPFISVFEKELKTRNAKDLGETSNL